VFARLDQCPGTQPCAGLPSGFPRHPVPRLTSTTRLSSVASVGCSVICVSHATASGGDEIGKQVAEKLGYLYVDEEIVARAAAQGGLKPQDIADEERRKSFANRFLNTLAEGGGDAWTFSTPIATSMEGMRPADIRDLIRETVVQTAVRGNVVIVAHAASFALEPGPRTLRVLVTASPAIRAKRVAAAEGLDDAHAERTIKESDAGRQDYLKRFYAVARESPTDYDLVVNTDHLSFEQGAEIVLRAADR
jgi:cytidylate kinase